MMSKVYARARGCPEQAFRLLGIAVLGFAGAFACERTSEPVALGPPMPPPVATPSAAHPSATPVGTVPPEPEPEVADAESAPAEPNPILPDCFDELVGYEPECVWKRFALAIQAKDAVVTFTKDYEGCPGDSFKKDLDRLARNATALLGKSSWISLMQAHCAAEIYHCELVGSLVWRGSVFELRLNFEGIGRVGQGDEWSRFDTPGAGGSCEG